MKYLLLILLLSSFGSVAKDDFGFRDKITEECMDEAIALEKTIVEDFRTHLGRIKLDDLHRLMEVRRVLIMENAPEAIKKLDELLIDNLNSLVSNNEIIKNHLTSINSFMEEFATYPITTNKKAFKDLSNKINALNSGI